MTKRFCLSFLALVLTTGCVTQSQTRYVPYGEVREPGAAAPFARVVEYKTSKEMLIQFPDCAIVLKPKVKEGRKHYARIAEQELTRALRGKINRVVGSTERRIVARERALDPGLGDPAEIRLLAENLSCDAVVFSEIDGGHTNLLVYAETRFAIDLRMERVSNGKLLWRARTEATRSDGGLPLSPLSILSNGFESAKFSADERDNTESVLADGIRRAVRTVPDSRIFTAQRWRP
ncbi:MAG: hypothetical protein HQ513_14515 [Rhodospirillales bacterium]|nr:hypothetical protein [Rhodospirillales bacterium]